MEDLFEYLVEKINLRICLFIGVFLLVKQETSKQETSETGEIVR